MKKAILTTTLIMCLLFCSCICVSAYENLNYTLEGGVLTLLESEGFEGELILPTAQMGAVDKIIVGENAGSDGVTALILTASDEIVVEKNAFFEHENIKAIELTAGNKVQLCGEGWNWDDRFNYGCFECSGLEKVIIKTKELDMSEGWAFHQCSELETFEATAENYTVGEHCFTDYYWNGTKHIFWIPWIENQTEDFVYLGDTIIAYKGDADEVYIPNGKLSLDIFNANGYDYDIKKIIMSDEITEIPETGFCTMLTFLDSLEQIKMPRGVTKIPNGCFGWNTKLKDVWISKTTTEIGYKVFPENCSATIHYEGTEDEWNNIELLSKSADVNESMYQKYLDTLTNMELHFNCTNSELKENKITAINLIDDYPYAIEVETQGETNSGILFVALMEGGYITGVETEITDGYYQLPTGSMGDTIKVFWFDGKESMMPLCEPFEYELPENSVVAIYNEYKEIYPDFFNSLLAEKVTDELLVEWIDYTRDLALEWIEADGKELTKESLEEALPEAMLSSLMTKRKFIKIRNVLVDLYPDTIVDLLDNGVIHEDLHPWAEAVRTLVFK